MVCENRDRVLDVLEEMSLISYIKPDNVTPVDQIMEERRLNKSFPDALVPILKQIGTDIASARKARRMTQEDLAERIGLARKTVVSMERGDPRVSFGAYAVAAWVMGLEKGLLSVFDPASDPVYQREARLSLPDRVRNEAGTVFDDLDF